MTLSPFQRQAITDAIRAMFQLHNDGTPANDFIERLWEGMTPEQLYMELGNFTRLTADL